jgi:hypothetical protein
VSASFPQLPSAKVQLLGAQYNTKYTTSTVGRPAKTLDWGLSRGNNFLLQVRLIEGAKFYFVDGRTIGIFVHANTVMDALGKKPYLPDPLNRRRLFRCL